MILTVKTDARVAHLTLIDDKNTTIGESHTELDRQMAKDLPLEIITLLETSEVTRDELTGILYFAGPGSFTGLRIGAATVNAMAYSLQLPIIVTKGEQWLEDGVQRLIKGENDAVAMPFYGAEAHITQPRK